MNIGQKAGNNNLRLDFAVAAKKQKESIKGLSNLNLITKSNVRY